MAFLEHPHFPSDINYKLVREISYVNHIVQNQAGVEQVNTVTTQPKHRYDVRYAVKDKVAMHKLTQFFHAVRGRLHSFRFNDEFDYTSSNHPEKPISINDQELMGMVNGQNTRFQLVKRYQAGTLATLRTITKPIISTLQVSIGGIIINKAFYTVSDSGVIEFTNNDQGDIQAISNTNPCKITTRNQLSTEQTVVLANIKGMPLLNDKRYSVLSATTATITLDVDARDLGEYQGGATFNTLPVSGEQVCAGFEFDVPVRFEQDNLSMRIDADNVYSVDSLALVEVFLP